MDGWHWIALDDDFPIRKAPQVRGSVLLLGSLCSAFHRIYIYTTSYSIYTHNSSFFVCWERQGIVDGLG